MNRRILIAALIAFACTLSGTTSCGLTEPCEDWLRPCSSSSDCCEGSVCEKYGYGEYEVRYRCGSGLDPPGGF